MVSEFAVKKNINDGIPVRVAVTKYNSSLRFTPNSQGKSPAELIHGRPVRTVLSRRRGEHRTPPMLLPSA